MKQSDIDTIAQAARDYADSGKNYAQFFRLVRDYSFANLKGFNHYDYFSAGLIFANATHLVRLNDAIKSAASEIGSGYLIDESTEETK